MSVWLLLFLSAACVLGYPSGAPPTACGHLTPRHPGAGLQTSQSPYYIQPQLTRIAQGNSLAVTISSPQGVPYEGFIVQARNPLSPTTPLGTFAVVPRDSKSVDCPGGANNNTVTHESKVKKTSLVFEWQPPSDYIGTVVFNGTVLQDYSTYWVGVQSDPVQVVKRSLVDSSGGQSDGISTTRRPKTTTLPPTLQPVVTETNRATTDTLTVGCDSLKTCFGFPSDCIANGDCVAVVACQMKSEVCEFEMRATASSYVAVGLSHDASMDLASVVECVNNPSGVTISMSWNGVGYVNTLITTSTEDLGVKLLAQSYENGVVYCKFERDAVTNVSNTVFDLTNNKYFLLLAAGKSSPKPGSAVSWHDVGKDVSAAALNLAQGGAVSGASKLLLRLHAAFMVSAWIGAASIGILLARYFKQTWVGNQLCGKDQWFAWHRFFMVLTWCLTVAGFVLIWVELKAWSAEQNPHAILGTITTGLAFIQPFMAALRPAPTASRRPLFNWAHWFVGNAAHILAIVTIFFATRLSKAEVPGWLDWVLVSYVAFHVVMHLIFSIVGCASEKKNVKRVSSFPMKDMTSSRNPLSAAERNLDAPHSCLRKFLLGVYMTVVLLLTIAIVVIVAAAPIGETLNKVVKLVTPN